MSKRITSLLVMVAALLLTMPSHAQTVAKKATAKSQVMKTKNPVSAKQLEQGKQARLKAQDAQVASIPFRAAVASQTGSISMEEAQAQKAADHVMGVPFAKMDWATITTAYMRAPKASQTGALTPGKIRPALNTRLFADKAKEKGRSASQTANGPRRVQGDKDAIITEIPATAEVKYYARSGKRHYYYSNGYSGAYYEVDQEGIAKIAFDGDDVYIQNPVAGFSSGTWVKGTKNGNTITVPLGQFLTYIDSEGYGLYITMANVTQTSSSFTGTNITTATEITYTIDEANNTITLNGTSSSQTFTLAWSDDDTVYSYGAPGGEYNTVLTLDEEFEPGTTDLVELPADATVEEWYAVGSGSDAVPTDANVAFVGSDVYISGIFSYFPTSWIKGTLSGSTVTFQGLQYLGVYSTSYNIWAVASDENDKLTKTFTFTYDAEARTLTLDEGQTLLANAADDLMYYLSTIESLTIYAEKPAPTQIDELPYSNNFDDTSAQNEFSVIDANSDGYTWTPGSGIYYISFNDPNDDWLVSPAIKLVAGTKYHFAIDTWARSSNYPETFEVKAATEATAEALSAGTTVIESQTVTSTSSVTIENNEFTVAESGYYYIGIHNTSNDMWEQYVDNFLIEAAPITAPVTLDLTVEDNVANFYVIDNNADGNTWSWSASYGAYYSYSSNENADDYLILPIILEADKNYNVIVTASCASAMYPEKFEVKVGKSASIDGLNITAITEQTIASVDDADFEGSFTSDAAGTWYVAIHATSDADMWRLNIKKLTIETGAEGTAPAAVTDFTAVQVPNELAVEVAFTAPTTTIAGEALANGDITKIEILRDGAVVQTIDNPAPGSAQTFTDTELTLGTHKYQVVPYGADGIGEKSEEIPVRVTAAVDVPYTFDLTQDLTDLFTIIDNNGDGSTWTFSTSYGTSYSYNSDNTADDYLISVPVNLSAGKSYKVTANLRCASATWAEKFEVKVGKEATVAGLNQTVIPETEVTSDLDDDYEGDFSVAEDGQYYIAIHAISDPDKYRLIVNTLTIEVGADPTAPTAGVLTATPGDEGALEVTLNYTAPTTAVNGDALTPPLDAHIYRDNEEIATIGTQPGANGTYIDESVEDGTTYTYYVVFSNESGLGQKSGKVSVYVGQDQLGTVQNFEITDPDANTVRFTWDAVEGINGGYVDAANVTYTIYSMAIETDPDWGYSYLVPDQVMATVTGETSATADFPVDEGDLRYQYFGISVQNATTAESDPAEVYNYLLVGEPEDLPIEEGFAEQAFHHAWDYSDDAILMVTDDASDDDGIALDMLSYESNTENYLILKKVNLKTAVNPTLIFDVKSSNISSVNVIGSVDGAPTSVIATQPVSSEYTTVKVPLNGLNGIRYSSIGISALFEEASETDWFGQIISIGSELVIDNIKIVDPYEYDLAINIDAPATVKAGESATITATVKNEGAQTVNGFSVAIKADGETLLEQTVNQTLAPYETSEFTTDYPTSIFDDAADVTIEAVVTYENDLNPENDEASTIISIKEPTAAQPEGVTAEQTESGIAINWSAPNADSSAEYTETFEESDGGWTFIDNDGDGYNWEHHINTGSGNYSAHNESSGLVHSASYDNNIGALTPDNWLVSPQAVLNGEFKFWAVGQDATYAEEHFAVYVSTTSATDVSTFVQVSDEFVASGEYQEFSVDLSSYAGQTGWIAIRHFNVTDMFELVIDDITYLVGGGEVESYNIYIDGELVGNTSDTSFTYTGDLSEGDHEVAVSAVYGSGESKPVIATVTVVSGIEQISIDGKPVDIYSLDGKLVRQQATDLNGLKGIYVVGDKKVIIK